MIKIIKTYTILENSFLKRLYFIRILNVFNKKGKKDAVKKTQGWFVDETKYLKEEEVKRILKVLKKNKERAINKNKKVAIRDYYIIKLGLSTGLRVQEMVDLKCRDFYLNSSLPYIFVRNGKGGKSRPVWFNCSLKQEIIDYLNWKKITGENTNPQAPFFLSSNTKRHMTTMALQKAFKRSIARAGIKKNYSIHSTRHTYASYLFSVSKNLKLVQEQLGHSSITTTQVYAHVFNKERKEALEKINF